MNFYTLFNPVRKKRGRSFKILPVMNPGLPRLNAATKRKIAMRINLVMILITVACLQVSASALAQKVTLNEKDAPLEKIFNDIREQTGYNFFYEHNILNGTAKVSINVKDASLPDVLNQCLANQPLVYTIAGKNIGVKKKEEKVVQKEIPLPLKDVTGQVTNKQSESLVNATVLIKRTRTGVLTDQKGNFTLRDVYSTDTLVISYVGYKQLYVAVGNKTVFNLVLEEATNALDQVVVQAYGQTSKRYNTGDIATVSAKEIERQPVMNPLEALIGKVPGLIITPTSGFASAPIKVELRGRSSLSGLPSEPLYIVDGVPINSGGEDGTYATGSSGVLKYGLQGPANGQSPLFSLNPQDIESITILKDADALAIYGSRGALGVILISTKKGQAGKTKFEISDYEGLSEVTKHYDLLNSQQYVAMRQEAFKNDGITPTTGNAYDLLVWDPNRYTDFQKFLWGQIGKTQNLQTSFSGGDKLTTFRISGGFVTAGGIEDYSGGDRKYTISFNLNHKSLDERLNISFASSYGYTQSNLIGLNGTVIKAPDTPPVFDSQGNLNYAGYAPISNQFPFSNLLQPYIAKVGTLNSSLNLSYELFKGLLISSNFGYRTANSSQTKFSPIISLNPATNPTGAAQFGNTNGTASIIEPQLEYNKLIGKGKLNVIAGGTIEYDSTNGNTITGNGYVNDNLLGSVANAATTGAFNASDEFKYAAIFSRLNYNWDGKYIVNISVRRDGSSRFGPGKQFGNFGAVGAAWIFTEENWLKETLPFLSFGKIRGSYGLTGNDNIADYLYLTQWGIANGQAGSSYQGAPANVPLLHANPDLQWETDKKLEAAIDMGFLKDHITLNLSWYRNRVGNQLVPYVLPYLTGFDLVEENWPANVQNTGYEIILGARIIDKKDFTWSVNFDCGRNYNKLLSFPNLAQSPYKNVYIIGQPLNTAQLLHLTGVDPQTGLYTIEDKNKDGQISYFAGPGDDRYPIDLSPKFDGGLGTDLRYKHLQVSLFFHIKEQVLPSAIFNGQPGAINANQSLQVYENSWQKPGDIAQYARFSTKSSTSYAYYMQSDGIYSNGSYIRLQNLSISYDLPDTWTKRIGMQGAHVFIRGQNLFIITKYVGVDPDVPGLGGLPIPKIITTGIKIDL